MSASGLKYLLLGTLAVGAVTSATPAAALTIALNDIGGVTGSQAEKGFRIAAKYWESVLTNSGTVDLNVGFSSLGSGILGGTSSALATYVPIDLYYDLLGASGNSALDAIAVSNLSPTNAAGSVQVTVPGETVPGGGVDPFSTRLAPTDGSEISSTIALSTANVLALGFDINPGADAEIQFSSDFAFDFDPTDGIATGKYDFIGVAVHEIGHALGFISGVDDFDFVAGTDDPVDPYWWGYGADMFRYSDADKLDWSIGTSSYFSIDGGQTALFDGYFSTGTDYGNGWQASHWLPPNDASQPCVDFRGIMNPYICSRLVDSVTGLDLALFDAIGWNINFDVLADNNAYDFTTAQMYDKFLAEVPEPGTWALMILGFGLTGQMVRRRRLAPTPG
ncbi:MAG: PEP-CTERM sorting domain-containing protein [Phenylobacterium sp.]|nr:MAG: PEP-CTERM sorting domain-containing protein [Phenylobacterium sp.]